MHLRLPGGIGAPREYVFDDIKSKRAGDINHHLQRVSLLSISAFPCKKIRYAEKRLHADTLPRNTIHMCI